MEKRNERRESPYDLESTPEFEEVVLAEENDQKADSELPVGFEDFLYEAWMEKRLEERR